MELLVPDILDPRIPVQRSAQSIGTLWMTKILSQPCIIPSTWRWFESRKPCKKILIILHA